MDPSTTSSILPEGIDVLGLIDMIKDIIQAIVGGLFSIFPLNIFFGASLVYLGIRFFKSLKKAASH